MWFPVFVCEGRHSGAETPAQHRRSKRRLREIVRIDLLPELSGVDLLIRAKPEAYGSSFGQLSGDVRVIGRWASQITR